MLALADTLGWPRFTLLGHSMGGMVAQHMLLAAPDRIEALILMDTAHGRLEGALDAAMIERAIAFIRSNGIEAWKQMMESQADRGLSTPADLRVRAERPGYVEFGERKLLAASRLRWWRRCSGSSPTVDDRLELLAAHTTPTLVIVGRAGRTVRRSVRAHGRRHARREPRGDP